MASFNKSNGKIIAAYVVPQMLGLVFNALYFIVDGVFIGNRLGEGALAAVGVAVPAVELMIALAMFMATGTGIIIGTAIGEGDSNKAQAVFNYSVGVITAVSIAIGIFGTLFSRSIAFFLGALPSGASDTITYLRYFFLFSPFLLMSFVLSTYARNNGRPRLAMAALITGSCSNILLDYVFMYPMNLGIQGAALATGLGPVFSVAILLPSFLRKKGALYFEKPVWVKGVIRKAVVNGFPAFIAEFSIGLVAFLYNRAIIKSGLGAEGLAAYLVIGYAALISITAFLGAAEGLQPVLSYFYGSGDKKRCFGIMKSMILFMTITGALFYGFVFFAGEGFFALFIKNNPSLIKFTADKACIYFLSLIPGGVNIVMISFMQCIHRSGRAFVISLMRAVALTAVFLAVLPLILPENGIWYAVVLAEWGTVLIAFLFYAGERANGATPVTAVKQW